MKTKILTSNAKNYFSFYLISTLLISLLFTGVSYRFFEVSGYEASSFLGILYNYGLAFFHIGFFFFLSSIIFFLLSFWIKEKLAKILFLTLMSVIFVLFVADSFVYQQFRMHINFAMIEMTFLGGGQIVSFSWTMILEILFYIFLCFSGVFVCGWAASLLTQWSLGKNWVIPMLLISLILGFAFFEVCYAVGFAKQSPELTQVRHVLPAVRPLHFNKLLMKLGVFSSDELYKVKPITKKNTGMKYPLNPLDCSGGKHYNIVFLYVDALRYDMLNEENMPNVYKFSKSSVVFKDHYSGGINTRHGIFTLFTGIPGSYWDSSLYANSGSALISALQKQNYEIGIFTGAPITMPEFNRTIFATVDNPRLQSTGSRAIERDENAILDFEKWLRGLPKDKNFFAFVFLDNVHGLDFPEDKENIVFEPYWKTVNQLELNNNFDREPFFNRYKNAVHYADKQIGRMLESLGKQIDLSKTIVVISSDHGEEFNDNKLNFWGHNGNFTKFQAKVPLVIHWPGKEAAEIQYRTSGLDIVPTILPEVLGCKNPISDYSTGSSLFQLNKDRKFLYVSNYSMDAYVEKERIVLINELSILNYLDNNNRPSKNKAVPPYLAQILEETSRYLK